MFHVFNKLFEGVVVLARTMNGLRMDKGNNKGNLNEHNILTFHITLYTTQHPFYHCIPATLDEMHLLLTQ